MASRFSIESVFRLIDKFTAPLGSITKSTKKFSTVIKKDFAKAQRTIKNFTHNVKKYAWLGVTAIAAAAGYMAKEGINLASSLFEVQNVVDVTFGESANIINKFADSAITAFGLSELNAKKFTGTLGAAIKSSGITGEQLTNMSTSLVGLTGDFASFYNLEHDEAFAKIRSGILGETEPLKQIGINMSVANLQAFALTQGITKQYQAMTEAEKVTLRYNYLMNASKDAQGDFARTLSSSLENQKRVLQTKFSQKLAGAFKKLIPLLIDLGSKLNTFLDNIDTDKIGDIIVKVFNVIKTGANIMLFFFKILKPIAPIIFGIIAAFAAYRAIMLVAAAAQMILNAAMSLNPVTLIIIGIGILIGLIIIIKKNWDKIWRFIIETSRKIRDAVVGFFMKIINWISTTGQKMSFIVLPLGLVFSALVEIAKQWDVITEKFKSGDILGGILEIGKAILSGLLAPIQGFLELVSKIPGVGNLAAAGAEKINQLRLGLTGKQQVIPPAQPYERYATMTNEEISRGELTIRDETGRAEMTNPPRGRGYQINMATSGGFNR